MVIKKCIRCGIEFKPQGRKRICDTCREIENYNKTHRICNRCGIEFKVEEWNKLDQNCIQCKVNKIHSYHDILLKYFDKKIQDRLSYIKTNHNKILLDFAQHRNSIRIITFQYFYDEKYKKFITKSQLLPIKFKNINYDDKSKLTEDHINGMLFIGYNYIKECIEDESKKSFKYFVDYLNKYNRTLKVTKIQNNNGLKQDQNKNNKGELIGITPAEYIDVVGSIIEINGQSVNYSIKESINYIKQYFINKG